MLATSTDSAKVQDKMKQLLAVPGALVVGLGNWKTGQCLLKDGHDTADFPNFKIETAIKYNSEVLKAKMSAAAALELNDTIDDVMISLTKQWHIIKLMSVEELFLYVALDRSKASISSAGLKLMQAKRELSDVLARYV